MNGKTYTATPKVLDLYKQVVAMRQALDGLYRKIVKVLLAEEGTDEWWAREIEEAKEDIRQGRYTTYSSIDEYTKSLKARM